LFVDDFADWFATSVPGFGLNQYQDRIGAPLRGLQCRREFERMPGHDPVVMIRSGDQRRGITGTRLYVLQG
jgi:hypothetical protein